MSDSKVLHYFGTPIEQLSREDLIEAVKYLYQEHAELLQSHRSLNKDHPCNLVQPVTDLATKEQWQLVEWDQGAQCSCIRELRGRIAALEANQ